MSKRGNRLVYGVGLNNADYVTQDCKFYNTWTDMLARGYSKGLKNKYPVYLANVTVNSHWFPFLSFKSWMENQNWEGLELDKDILIMGNREYSKTACAFIPRYLNTLYWNQTTAELRGVYHKLGKEAEGPNPYVAYVQKFREKAIYLGSYPTAAMAHRVWQVSKADEIESAVELYTTEKFFRQDIVDALMDRVRILRQEAKLNRITYSL